MSAYPDVFLRPALEQGGDMAAVVDRDKQTPVEKTKAMAERLPSLVTQRSHLEWRTQQLSFDVYSEVYFRVFPLVCALPPKAT